MPATDSAAPPTTPGITVRAARPDELAAAGAVVRLAYEADGYGGDYLDVADRVVGCVTFVLPGSRWAELSGPGQAEFRMLGVHPDARGRGVGRALAQWCLDRARRAGAAQVLICSLPTMTVAHGLYRSLGFRRRSDLDWTPVPDVELLGFEVDLEPADH